MTHRILQGDCIDLLSGLTVVHSEPCHHIAYLDLPDNSVDAIVTDPPYGLSFMARDWDHAVPGPAYWTAALRVAKPGAHLVAFGGTRTYHRLACAIEDAGWEIRDCLMYLYGSGFPKSLDVSKVIDKAAGAEREILGNKGEAAGRKIANHRSLHGSATPLRSSWEQDTTAPATDAAKQWEGWGTALAPSWEPIILARKPFKSTVADNVQQWGTGALNIDGGRIGNIGGGTHCNNRGPDGKCQGHNNAGQTTSGETVHGPNTTGGRWPKNCILDEESAAMLDGQSGQLQSGYMENINARGGGYNFKGPPSDNINVGGGCVNVTYADRGGASRFFYTAKASRAEREGGLDGDTQQVGDGRKKAIDNPYQRGKTERRNTHSTVKPLDLMRWLVRLVTPPGGTVLDPFCGSGTTLCAARIEGFNSIGIEREAEYCEIARKRIAFAGVEAGDATADDADVIGGPVQLGLLK